MSADLTREAISDSHAAVEQVMVTCQVAAEAEREQWERDGQDLTFVLRDAAQAVVRALAAEFDLDTLD